MGILNKLLLFFLKAVLVFLALNFVLSYIGLEDGFLQFLRDMFTNIFNSGKQIAMFEPNNDYSEWDTKLIVYRTDISENGEFQYYSTKYLSYVSLLMFLSLVTASPIDWFRKCIGYFFGLILILVYANIMAAIIVQNLSYKIKKLAAVDYSDFMYNINSTLFEVFIVHGFEWMGFVPFVLWFVTTIRLKDFDISLQEGSLKK